MRIELDGREYTADEIRAMDAPPEKPITVAAATVPPVDAPPATVPLVAPVATASAGTGATLGAFTATPGQNEAFKRILALKGQQRAAVMAVVGYAGTGKTTMIRMSADLAPLVVTPTGKAALRVSEASGLPASTIHRWLYKAEEDAHGRAKFVRRVDDLAIPRSRLVFIDEASMVTPDVWTDVWRTAQAHDLKIVAIGDGFQLPPVQDRNAAPFSLLDKRVVPDQVVLTDVLRQAQDSPVIRASMALRDGMGVAALGELPKVPHDHFAQTALATYAAQGVIIVHSNASRFTVNNWCRALSGLHVAAGPCPSEPLLVLRNNYDLDLYNGEQVIFDGWRVRPEDAPETVIDRYSGAQAQVHFGVAWVNGQSAVIGVEELAGSVKELGATALIRAAERWARRRNYYEKDRVIPYLSANYGYCYTAHKSQGSEWPYALVALERSIKLNTEDGRRWAYTAITRAKTAAAVYYGSI